jgi:hypothetical protein
VTPPSLVFKIVARSPTAKQVEVVGQLTPATNFPPLMVVFVQVVPPSDVRNAVPKLPTATHAVVLAQLIAKIADEPVACATQLDPPLVVARIRPSDDPTKQVVALGQLTALSGLPSGFGFCQVHVGPAAAILSVEPGAPVASLRIVGRGSGAAGATVRVSAGGGGCGVAADTP